MRNDIEVRLAFEPSVRLKPPFTAPCNHCGACCTAQLCPAAERLFSDAPCPALNEEQMCGLVIAEMAAGLEVLRHLLGIGMGCSMPDDGTTDEEIMIFDAQCLARFRA